MQSETLCKNFMFLVSYYDCKTKVLSLKSEIYVALKII